MDIGLFHSFWTVLLIVIFVGIVVWAYSSKRRGTFERAARLPLEEGDDPSAPGMHTGEKHHG